MPEQRPGRSGKSGEATQLAKERPGEPGGPLLDATASEHRAEQLGIRQHVRCQIAKWL